MKLDRIDIKILRELQKNGRISNIELAELVNLSPSPCLMRVKKLQAEGFITGYSALINVSKLGQTLTVFTEITLKNHRQIDFARFLTAIEKIDSAVECHLVSGGYDYLVEFVTGDRLASVCAELVTALPERQHADAHVPAFAAFFHSMLEQGVYLPPSAFESWFVSAAHDGDAVDRVLDALPAAASAAAQAFARIDA